MKKTIALIAAFVLMASGSVVCSASSSETAKTDEVISANLTAENCPELADLLQLKDPMDPSVSAFAEEYKDKTVEFDGCIWSILNHGDYNTQYDILIGAGDFDPNVAYGPSFQFVDVNTSDMELDSLFLDEVLAAEDNVHVIAKVCEYDEDTGLFELDPVSVEVREVSETRQKKYDYHSIPVGNHVLTWGMSRENVEELLGKPSAEEETQNGVRLVYESEISGGLGKCTFLSLDIVEEDGGFNGLGAADMTLSDTTKEAVTNKLTAFYGAFSEESSGKTEMERQLQAGDPNLFYEVYSWDEWKLGTLDAEDFDQLKTYYENYNKSLQQPYSQLTADMPLMYINLIGSETGERYSCRLLFNPGVLLYWMAAEAQ